MDNPWWINEPSGGFAHDNDYPNSSYDPYTCETQYEYICCNYCGDNHYSEQCPHFSTWDYMESDFSKAQPHLYDDTFSLNWNQDHSLSWDPHSSFSYASHSHISLNTFVDENTPIHEKKPTLEDKLQCILDNVNEMNDWTKQKFHEHSSALQNLAFQASEIASSLEFLNQKDIFHDNSSEQLTTGSEEELPTVCNTFAGDCELEFNVDEENIECSVEVSILEPNPCCFGQDTREEVHEMCALDSSTDVLTLTDESQVDFVGCSQFLEAPTFALVNKLVMSSLNSINTCTLQLLIIDEVHVINEHPFFLKHCCLKRNKDEVVMVFDTYD